jgi:hypothetical protein
MKNKLIFISLLLFTATFYSQEDKFLKEDVVRLVDAFNLKDKKTITEYVYPKVFEKGLSPVVFEIALSGIAAINPGTSELNNDNTYEIKNIANRKFCVIKFKQFKKETFKLKKEIKKEEFDLYIADRKKQILESGNEFDYSYDEKKKTLAETIILNNKIIGISDELTQNKWKFLFNWNMYEPATVDEIFGEDIKKELGL